jgi:iron complex outermembrane receptor protein
MIAKNNKLAGFTLSKIAETVALTIALGFSTVALAETTNNADSTETIQVLGESYRNTATKTSLTHEQTPQIINIIDSEQLDQRAVKSLGEALVYTPGINTDFYGSDANFLDLFTIRGFDVSQSYYNGVSLQTLTGWNLQPQIDPIALEQIEVFKGPTSVLYGAMPPGGMVNLIGKSPQKQNQTTIGASLGTDNLKEFSIDSAGQIADSDFSYRLVGLARQQDTLTSVAGNERYVFAPSIDWHISDKTLLNVNLYYQNDPQAGNNTAMPESVLLDNESDFSLGDENWNNTEREFLLAGYKFQHEFGNDWTYFQNFRYMNADFKQQNSYVATYDETSGDVTRALYSTEETSQGFVFDNQLAKKLKLGTAKHNLLAGIDYQKLDGTALYAGHGTSVINVNNSDNNLIDSDSVTTTVYSDDKIHSEQIGVYVQDQIEWGNAVLIAGLRYDNYSGDGTSYGSAYEIDATNLSYRVGALYNFDNGFSPFVNYATSFEPINTGDFDPELGRQIELGLKYQSSDSAFSGSAALFNIIKSDVLMVDPDSIGSGSYTYVQLGEVTSQGLELEAKWFMTDELDVSASYAYLDVEVTRDTFYKGTTPIYNAEHSVNLWANYSVYNGALNGAQFGTGIRYVGEMQKDASNTQGMVPDYTVVDLAINYDLGYASSSLDGATVGLSVNNVFDTESYTCYDQNSCWNNADRSAQLNVNYSF